MTEDEPFLKRWSRRKVDSREGLGEVERAPERADAGLVMPRDLPQPADAQPAQGEGQPQDKRELTEADFADADFDALDAESDYSRFLAKGVPDAIKHRALRKLWASDPIFSQIEPFQEYAGDFTDAGVAVPAGTLKTAYRVGKGFLTDEEVAVWEKLGHPQKTIIAAADAPPAPPAASAGALAGAAGPPEPSVALAEEPADQPEVHTLIRQSDIYFASLYPAESNHLVDIAALSEPNVRLVVARRGGLAVGCGALVIGADGEAELKRMFVVPEARGHKLGSRILAVLEAAATAGGVRVLRLETGVRQPEALALYRRRGYTERGPFGSYQREPLSTFFEKWIG
jgi:putative acetyltransferase